MTDLLAAVCAGPFWEDNNVTLGFFPQLDAWLFSSAMGGGKRGKDSELSETSDKPATQVLEEVEPDKGGATSTSGSVSGGTAADPSGA